MNQYEGDPDYGRWQEEQEQAEADAQAAGASAAAEAEAEAMAKAEEERWNALTPEERARINRDRPELDDLPF